jgi:hypothetical protein
VSTLGDATWDEINALRDRLMARRCASVEQAAQAFVADLVESYPSIVLARLFLVLPFEGLPSTERAVASRVAAGHPSLKPRTPILSLFGTAGSEPAWRDRRRSVGHRAIPLINRTFVQDAPMIAKLLADLEVDLAALDDGSAIATRHMLGGVNLAFFVADAVAALDRGARHVIPARDFVERYGVRTVFGMGGAYVDGTLAIAIAFTSELLDRPTVDRFPSLIGNFKLATSAQRREDRLYASPAGDAG